MKRYILFFLTGLGIAYIPGSRGTYGTVVALIITALLMWAVPEYTRLTLIVLWLVVVWATLWLYPLVTPTPFKLDDRRIVTDEWAGFWIALIASPVINGYTLLIAFVLFRLFDITKPWPISWVDKTYKTAFGVILDDIIAGIYVLPFTWAAYYFFSW